MTRADCQCIVKGKDAEAERTRATALWNARRKFILFDHDVTAIGRALRELREGRSSRRSWRLWQ